MKIHPLFENLLRRLLWPLFTRNDNPWHDWEVASARKRCDCGHEDPQYAPRPCLFEKATVGGKDARIGELEAKLAAIRASGTHCYHGPGSCGREGYVCSSCRVDIRNAALGEAAQIVEENNFRGFGIDLRLGHVAQEIRARKS